MQLAAIIVIVVVVVAVVIDALASHAGSKPARYRDETAVTTEKIIVDLTKRR